MARARRGRGRGALPPGYNNLPGRASATRGPIAGLNGGTSAPPMPTSVPGAGAAPGGGGASPTPRGRSGNGGGGNIGIGGTALAGPGGRQLQARVASGQITGAQAQQTMQQRQTLAKALGPNWRDKLQVGGKSFAQVNRQLKANPGNAKLAALRKRLTANRSTLLEDARKKKGAGAVAGAAETGGE